jgi:hypothetical protein
MSIAIHPLFTKELELRAAAQVIASNPLYQDWDSEEHPALVARKIEIETEIQFLQDSEEYINAITPCYASVHDCYGGI